MIDNHQIDSSDYENDDDDQYEEVPDDYDEDEYEEDVAVPAA